MAISKSPSQVSMVDDFEIIDEEDNPWLPIRSKTDRKSTHEVNVAVIASNSADSFEHVDSSDLATLIGSINESNTIQTEKASSSHSFVSYEWNDSQSKVNLYEQVDSKNSRSTDSLCGSELRVQVEVVQQDGHHDVLVSMFPPKQPLQAISHVPVDIVLVIDVSGSMDRAAPFPDKVDTEEDAGLTILDLTKHAARTVLENLNSGDRLGIVKFSTASQVVQDLIPMNDENKKETIKRIDDLEAGEATNLWGGLCDGLDLFEKATNIGNVPGMYVLTDGLPNHMNPAQGFVKKLKRVLSAAKSRGTTAPTIHTFGFGYNILSDLMHSIAEVGRGNYCFIPDVGMIGTVFVHAVANLFSTYATDVRLEISTSKSLQVHGPEFLEQEFLSDSSSCIHLGNLRYGQPRGVILRCDDAPDNNLLAFTAELCCRVGGRLNLKTPVDLKVCSKPGAMGSPLYVFQKARHDICDNIAGLYPRSANGERQQRTDVDQLEKVHHDLDTIAEVTKQRIDLVRPENLTPQHLNLKSLHDDVKGQIHLALNTSAEKSGRKKGIGSSSFFQKWGRHYLASILHAHVHEMCNSFKDPGPLRYGIESPLFIKCRDELDASFDTLPAPKQQNRKRQHMSVQGHYDPKKVCMARYNRYHNPCFLGSCPILTGTDSKSTIEDLEVGQSVWTLNGMRRITAIIKTPMAGCSQNAQICEIGSQGLYVTPYHPIMYGGEWIMPVNCSDSVVRPLDTDATVFSLLLEPSSKPNAHTIEVGGIICTTLGHGLTQPAASDTRFVADVRVHHFFGDYNAVTASLSQLSKDDKGRQICGGVRKDPISSLACDFLSPDDLIY